MKYLYEIVIELRNAGLTFVAIGERLSISTGTAMNLYKKHRHITK